MTEYLEPYIGQAIFHGGCYGCTQQQIYGYEFCIDCCYFQPNWSLPNLNNEPPNEVDLLKERLKERHK